MLRITSKSSLMEGYRTAVPVVAGSQLAVMLDDQGRPELYSLNSNGDIVLISQQSSSEVGWQTKTIMTGKKAFRVAQLQDGTPVIYASENPFSGEGEQVGAVYARQSDGSFQNVYPWVPGLGRLHGMDLGRDSSGKLNLLGLVTLPDSENGLGIFQYNETAPNSHDFKSYFYQALSGWSDASCHILPADGHNMVRTVLLHRIDNNPAVLWASNQSSGDLISMAGPNNTPNALRAFTQTSDGQGGAVIAALGLQAGKTEADGMDLYGIRFSDGKWQTWQKPPLQKFKPLRHIVSAGAIGEAAQLIGVSTDGRLHHIEQDLSSGAMLHTHDLGGNFSHASATVDSNGAIHLFAVSQDSELSYFLRNPNDTDWSEVPVKVEAEDNLQMTKGYTTVLQLTDADGNPQLGGEIQVSVPGEAVLDINGKYVLVGPLQTYTAEANFQGQVIIREEVDSLAASTLQVSAGTGADLVSLRLEPNQNLQDRFHSVTAEDVENGLQLPAQQAEALAPALQKAASLLKKKAADTAQIDMAQVQPQRWHLSRDPHGNLAFRELSADELHQVRATAMDLPRLSSNSILPDWGDLWEAVRKGVAQVSDFVVHTVGDQVVSAINATFTVVIDGISHLMESSITIFQQAMDLIAGLLEAAGKFFIDLFKWLGILFDWDGIQRAQAVIKHFISEGLDYMIEGATNLKTTTLALLSTIQQNYSQDFSQRVGSDGNQGIRNYARKDQSEFPKVPEDPASNFLNSILGQDINDKFAHFGFDQGLFSSSFVTAVGNLVKNAAAKEIKGLGNKIEALFSFVVQQIDSLTPDQLLTKIQSLLLAEAFDTVKTVVGLVFDLLELLGKELKRLANTEWKLPVVDELISTYIVKRPLPGVTPLDVVSFSLAVAANSNSRAERNNASLFSEADAQTLQGLSYQQIFGLESTTLTTEVETSFPPENPKSEVPKGCLTFFLNWFGRPRPPKTTPPVSFVATNSNDVDHVALFAGLSYAFSASVAAGAGIGAGLKFTKAKGNPASKGLAVIKILSDFSAWYLSAPFVFSRSIPSEVIQARSGVWSMRFIYTSFFCVSQVFEDPASGLTFAALNSITGTVHALLAGWLIGIEQNAISKKTLQMDAGDSVAKLFQNLTGATVKMSSLPVQAAQGLAKLTLIAGFDGFLGTVAVPSINYVRTTLNLQKNLDQRME